MSSISSMSSMSSMLRRSGAGVAGGSGDAVDLGKAGDAGNAGDDGQGGKAQGEDEGPGLESKVQAFSEKCELPCELSQSNVLLSELDKSALHQALVWVRKVHFVGLFF